MPNRLALEKSPYLLQHAHNPVDWFPWGEEAFAKAREEQKPIFLSIGYSTCHWCHVMAHESFESTAVAAVLNDHFVSIKVDREERPDVDRVYMTYVQALSGHGGWPLSAWLTPDLKPFFGGTYFPPEDRYGRPGLAHLLRSLAQAWKTEREKLLAEGARAVSVLQEHLAGKQAAAGPGTGQDFTEAAGEAFETCFQYYYESFDTSHGGFGSPPKFPRASNLNFIFRVAAIQGSDTEAGEEALKMAGTTLRKMAQGGIHDHVGGGFHRYSVDESWFVPHFEKMLYDQAQIALNYLEAYQATLQPVHLWQARDILAYVERDLAHPQGGFYSAEDADSAVEEGGDRRAEGAYYVWTAAQIREALRGTVREEAELSPADVVAFHYGVKDEGNVPEALDPHREFAGKNILMQRHTLAETAGRFGLSLQAANDVLAEALQGLRGARKHRPRPPLDDKVITAWNGLMISAFARAAQVAGSADDADAVESAGFARRATSAAEFIRHELYDPGTRTLFRSYRQGRAPTHGFAEDYAFLVQGLIDLYEATFEIEWLRWADLLQDRMDELFWDEAGGGYFSSSGGDPSILLRLKEDYDGAEPAPSSVGTMNLLRLAAIAPDPDRRSSQAMRTLNALRPQWSRTPHALPQALCALEYALIPRRQVVIAGERSSPAFRALWREAQHGFGPRRALFGADAAEGQAWLAQRAPWIAAMKPLDGTAAAYVCEHYTCQAPVTTPAALRAQLR